MSLEMCRLISEEMQIFCSVVCLAQIDMVDEFGLDQSPPQSSLHNFDMLPAHSAPLAADPVSVSARGPLASSGEPESLGVLTDG